MNSRRIKLLLCIPLLLWPAYHSQAQTDGCPARRVLAKAVRLADKNVNSATKVLERVGRSDANGQAALQKTTARLARRIDLCTKNLDGLEGRCQNTREHWITQVQLEQAVLDDLQFLLVSCELFGNCRAVGKAIQVAERNIGRYIKRSKADEAKCAKNQTSINTACERQKGRLTKRAANTSERIASLAEQRAQLEAELQRGHANLAAAQSNLAACYPG